MKKGCLFCKMFFNKKSQSEVISTVLMILIAIVAIVIIASLVIPYVKNNFSGTGCIDVANKVEVTNNPDYTCYNNALKQMRVQIHMGDSEDKIKGFSVELGGASSKSYQILNQTTVTGVGMYDGVMNGTLEIPGKNEERTYNFTVTKMPEVVRVYPILKEKSKTCDPPSVLNSVVTCM